MNNRRSFLTQMLKASVACMALPSAVTYNRIWKPVPKLPIDPAWGISHSKIEVCVYTFRTYAGKWVWVNPPTAPDEATGLKNNLLYAINSLSPSHGSS